MVRSRHREGWHYREGEVMDSKTLFLIGVVLLAIAFGPLLSIWALNTLFPTLHIEYTLQTWFAVIVLGSFTIRKGSK